MSWSQAIEPLAAALQAQANLLPALEASTMRLRAHNDELAARLKTRPAPYLAPWRKDAAR